MPRLVPRLALLFASIALAVLAAEGIVRLSGYHPLPDYRSRLGRRVIEQPAFAIPYLYEPYGSFSEHWPSNPRGTFDPISNGVFYRINNQGFRGEDFAVARDGRARVALLGDSLCFGNGVPDRHHFGTHLQRRLTKGGVLGADVEVLNFGLGNYDTVSEAALFRLKVAACRPDVCIVLYYPNDLRDIGGRNGAELMTPRCTAADLRAHLYLADLVLRPLDAMAQERRYVDELQRAHRPDAPGVPMFRAALRDLREQCDQIGATLLLAIHPVLLRLDDRYPLRDAHAFVRAEAEAAGVAALDLLPAFEGRAAEDLWVHPLDPHPNEAAHAIVANALFDEIKALRGR